MHTIIRLRLTIYRRAERLVRDANRGAASGIGMYHQYTYSTELIITEDTTCQAFHQHDILASHDHHVAQEQR